MTPLEAKQLERRVEDLELQLKLIRAILDRMANQEVRHDLSTRRIRRRLTR
jgi:hypothetical protein